MLDWPAYLAGLVAVLAMSAATGLRHKESREQLWRTAGAIAFVWAFGILYTSNTGNQDPWEFNLFIDSAAMAAILWHPAGRAQAIVGWLYLGQLICHSSYGVRELLGFYTDILLYYNALTGIAWLQLLAVGVWCGGIWLQDRLPRLRAAGHPMGRLPPRRAGGEKV